MRTRNALNDSGIYSLNDLINIDYNELKDKLCDISNIELLELVNFLHSYGFLIKGYDQTNYNTRPLKKEQTLETEEVNVEKVEQENLEILRKKIRNLIILFWILFLLKKLVIYI